jgi:adenylosuccinate synthase
MQLFKHNGVHCIVDGQFGSTGKGALSAYLAEQAMRSGAIRNFAGAIYSGGPNSGHTFYHDGDKHVLKQLPSFSVYCALKKVQIPAYLSAGAIIDRDILKAEAEKYPFLHIFVHPNAAIVTDEDRKAEECGSIAEVAGTRSGTGEALVRKIRREPSAIANNSLGNMPSNVVIQNHRIKPESAAYFMEVSQGFSLGINSHFYPKVTSRECTAMQGLADARVPARRLAMTYMAVRTYPIRVGNVDGYSSGEWYSDQSETNWDNIGVPAEITTVTKRVRRVASFSMDQFYDACHANFPDVVFISHMDYLKFEEQIALVEDIQESKIRLNQYFALLYGFGPNVQDVKEYINDH